MNFEERKPTANQFYVICSNLFYLLQKIHTIKGRFIGIGRKCIHVLNWIDIYFQHRRIWYYICRTKGFNKNPNRQQREEPLYTEGGRKVSKYKRETTTTLYWEWVLWFWEVVNTQDKKGGNIESTTQYNITYIRGTVSDALLCGQQEKMLIGVRERRVFMYVNTDFFWAVADYPNKQKYRIS